MDSSGDPAEPGTHQHPTLYMVLGLLNSVTTTLERSGEEKFLLLNKVKLLNGIISFVACVSIALVFSILFLPLGLIYWPIDISLMWVILTLLLEF